MLDLQDKIRGVLFGLATGDRIGGPLRMALCLSESLIAERKFDSVDVYARYAKWYFDGGFDTGPTASRVFEYVSRGMSIGEAVALVDEESSGLTAGCNPMHRAIVLAVSPDIADADLPDIAIQEAKLTHHHPLAGEVSAITTSLCRKLIQGGPIEMALNKINHLDWMNRPLSNGGFAPDVFNAAVHFVRETDSFQDAIGNSLGFAGANNYCPVVVGALAGAIYGKNTIPEQHYSHCRIMEKVSTIATNFIHLRR